MALCSKLLSRVPTSCQEYVHPWTPSCYTASAGLLLHALQSSFRLYVTVYALALLMKGRKPSKKDIKRTLYGILQSTAFIGCHAVGFSLCACFMRHVLGYYNFFTFAFLPTFVSSWFAILVERPSRRSLLSLYVTNIASETLYQMLVWRKVVKPIAFADVLIFTSSISCLLYLYRSQYKSADSIYSLIRFIVGPYEQLGYTPDSPDTESAPRQFPSDKPKRPTASVPSTSRGVQQKRSSHGTLYSALTLFFHCIKEFKNYLKTVTKCQYCSHPHGCVHYWLQGGTKVFAIGYGLQLSLRTLMQMRKIARRPVLLLRALKSSDTFSLGVFLGGFSFLYRFISCMLRRSLRRDTQAIAIPAAFVAGFTFCFYRSNTIALYVMWKSLQILYLVGRDNKVVPEVPHASIFFHCLSTAILFQAAIFEPQNLRSSYWNFLHNMSGGRIGAMDRKCLDMYGLDSSKMVEMIKNKHRRS
ncbi:transmembrane protein 135-like [Planococcus citri]|uniref:transmembrane protein 135-like n=1 Tax=Planococcus citri TaxID=170843 RepID=UPI0031F99D1D